MTSKPVFDIKESTYSLSIQLNLNGFSFCIASNEGKIIVFEDNTQKNEPYTEQELLNALKKAFNTKPELQAQFKKIELVFENELFALVPSAIFDSDYKKDYLKYNVKVLATDFIAEDPLEDAAIVNVFIPYVNINNYIIDKLGEFNYQHASGILVAHALAQNQLHQTVFLYFGNQHFYFVTVKEKELLLANCFLYHSNEDVLYYVLFCMEQLELSPDRVPIKFLSPVENAIYDILYTYVRSVERFAGEQNDLLHQKALNI